TRPHVSEVFAGETLVRASLLPGEWTPVSPGRQAVFDASCAYLLGGFAVRLRRSYELSRVEEQPELINRGTVSSALSREYPRMMRETRQTGTVTLRFRVLEDGRVDRASVSVMALTHPDFAQAAVRVVYVMRFRQERTPPEASPPFPPFPSRP